MTGGNRKDTQQARRLQRRVLVFLRHTRTAALLTTLSTRVVGICHTYLPARQGTYSRQSNPDFYGHGVLATLAVHFLHGLGVFVALPGKRYRRHIALRGDLPDLRHGHDEQNTTRQAERLQVESSQSARPQRLRWSLPVVRRSTGRRTTIHTVVNRDRPPSATVPRWCPLRPRQPSGSTQVVPLTPRPRPSTRGNARSVDTVPDVPRPLHPAHRAGRLTMLVNTRNPAESNADFWGVGCCSPSH
jgi:hypothetical protein